jgi:cytochrome c556
MLLDPRAMLRQMVQEELLVQAAEAEKFEAAVKTGNLDTIKAAVGSLGGACKACHYDFRAEKYSSN